MSHYLLGENIHANGIRQHYLRYGGQSRRQHPPVIVLPGITSPAITWGFVGEGLGRAYDCYILDIRGRGLSSAEDDLDYSLDAQAADVIGFAEAMKFERYSVLGHSMGARIAIRMAPNASGLDRLVLAEPPMSGPGRRPYPADLDWYLDSIALAKQGCDAEAMRKFCPTWTDENLQLRAEWLHTCNPRAIRASYEGFSSDDIHRDLPGIRVPTLLVAGADSQVILESDIAEWHSLVADLAVRTVPKAGHMLPLDNEEGFYLALGDFLGAGLV